MAWTIGMDREFLEGKSQTLDPPHYFTARNQGPMQAGKRALFIARVEHDGYFEGILIMKDYVIRTQVSVNDLTPFNMEDWEYFRKKTVDLGFGQFPIDIPMPLKLEPVDSSPTEMWRVWNGLLGDWMTWTNSNKNSKTIWASRKKAEQAARYYLRAQAYCLNSSLEKAYIYHDNVKIFLSDESLKTLPIWMQPIKVTLLTNY